MDIKKAAGCLIRDVNFDEAKKNMIAAAGKGMGSVFSGRVFRMILLIDKPRGITSFGVVSTVRKALSKYEGKVKVGHSELWILSVRECCPFSLGRILNFAFLLPSGKAYRAERFCSESRRITEDITGTILCERKFLRLTMWFSRRSGFG